MKKSVTVLTLLVLTLALWAGSAFAYDIDDEYVGEDDHGWGDVIGLTSQFDIFGADVSLSGSTLGIDIFTNFSGLGDNGLFSAYTWGETPAGEGVGYGDLFLNDSWNPNGTNWTYGFALDDQWGNGGTGTLYSLNPDGSDVLLAEDYINPYSGAIFRNGQEVGVAGGAASTGNIGTWTIDEAGKVIHFSIDISDTTLLSSPEIALHWGETCANDVIEGAAPVPEPATMLLFGVGLISFAMAGRKKFLTRN